jgi:hypothetical protein
MLICWQEPRKALYGSPLADPLLAATWPTMEKGSGESHLVAWAAQGQTVGPCVEASEESYFRKADKARCLDMPGIPDACLVFLLAHACNVDLACCDMLCVARNSADVSQARGARVHQSNAERSERNLFPGLYLT